MITNDILDTIKRRRSVRLFKDDPVPDDAMAVILEAGTFAPNAGGQAWHFTAVQNWDLLERLNLVAKEGARNSGLSFLEELGNDPNFHCMYHAPALIIVSGDGNSSVPLDADCAAANQNMLLAAESLGLGTCWIYFVLMAFGQPAGQALMKELKIPEGYRPMDAAVVGYPKGLAPEAAERKQNVISVIK